MEAAIEKTKELANEAISFYKGKKITVSNHLEFIYDWNLTEISAKELAIHLYEEKKKALEDFIPFIPSTIKDNKTYKQICDVIDYLKTL